MAFCTDLGIMYSSAACISCPFHVLAGFSLCIYRNISEPAFPTSSFWKMFSLKQSELKLKLCSGRLSTLRLCRASFVGGADVLCSGLQLASSGLMFVGDICATCFTVVVFMMEAFNMYECLRPIGLYFHPS